MRLDVVSNLRSKLAVAGNNGHGRWLSAEAGHGEGGLLLKRESPRQAAVTD